MNKIIPAIIPESLEHLKATLESIAAFTNEVQIDIVDGVFVSFTSWPYKTAGEEVSDMKNLIHGFSVEMDLMVENPEQVIESYLQAGVARIVVHLESVQNLNAILALKRTYDFQLGFSILNDTDISVLISAIDSADYVQLMGIAKIGSQGQPFDTRVLTRVAELKTLYPNLPVSIDGSVQSETLPLLRNVGATRFVVGSAILKNENPAEAYRTLSTL